MFLSSEITVWNKGKSYSGESLWLQLPRISVLSTLPHFLTPVRDIRHVVMKYEMHAFYPASLRLQCEVFSLQTLTIQGSAVEARLPRRQPGPAALAQSALLHRASLILHFPCDKFPGVSAKRQITFHYPQETNWPFCCRLDDTWAVHPEEAKASTDLFSLNKAQYWKHIWTAE